MRKTAYLNNQDVLNVYKTSIYTQHDKGYPIVQPLYELPSNIKTISFNYALSNKDYNQYVHFYIQDYLFNRIWNAPEKYLEILQKYKGVFTPDFSLLVDMPEPLQQFNHYRNQWLASYYQANNITVIPSVSWSTEQSYKWCFKGQPKNSIIAVNAVGSTKELEARYYFWKGYDVMLNKLKPKTVLVRCFDNLKEQILSKTGDNVIFLEYETFK